MILQRIGSLKLESNLNRFQRGLEPPFRFTIPAEAGISSPTS